MRSDYYELSWPAQQLPSIFTIGEEQHRTADLIVGKINEGRRDEGVNLLESYVSPEGGGPGGANSLTERFAG